MPDFSSTHSTTALSGGWWCSPTTSTIWYRMLAAGQALHGKLADELTTTLAGPVLGTAGAHSRR